MSAVNIEDFLPSIFRKLKPRSQSEPDEPTANLLAPQESVAPLTIVPSIPPLDSPTPPQANSDYVGTMVQPNIAAPVMDDTSTRPRRVETDSKGRPVANTTMQGDAQAVDLNQRLHNYQPQEAHGWWDKWGKQMVTGALRALSYGPGGAIGGALGGGIHGATNSKLGDEQWKAREIAKSDPDVARINANQVLKTKLAQEALQGKKTEADTNLANTRRDMLLHPNPKAGPVHHDVNAAGNMVIVDSSGLATEVHDKDGKPVAKLSNDETLQPDPINPKIIHKLKGGKDTGLSYVADPQYGYVPSGAAMSADATAGNRAQERGDKGVEAQTALEEATAAEADALARHKDATERIAKLQADQLKFDTEEPQWKQYQDQINQLQGEARSAQSDASRAAVTKRAKKAEAARYSRPMNTTKPKNDPLGIFTQ